MVADNTRTSLSADTLRNAFRVVHPDAPAADLLTVIADLVGRLALGFLACPLRDRVAASPRSVRAAGINRSFVPGQAVSIVA